MTDPRRIDELSAERSQLYLERSSITFLECAINLLLTHCSKARVIEILKRQARIVAELD